MLRKNTLPLFNWRGRQSLVRLWQKQGERTPSLFRASKDSWVGAVGVAREMVARVGGKFLRADVKDKGMPTKQAL